MITQAEMHDLTRGLPSKSAKMRALARAGVPRADIARFLGTRYQFVRNVLEAENAKSTGFAETPQTEFAQLPPAQAATKSERRIFRMPMANGQVTIPAELLAGIGASGDDMILMEIDGNGLRVWSLDASIRRAQAQFRKVVPRGLSLVDELIADRRSESERESGGE